MAKHRKKKGTEIVTNKPKKSKRSKARAAQLRAEQSDARKKRNRLEKPVITARAKFADTR